jgi:hypothetical protein
MKSIGSAVVTAMLLLVALGLTIGLLLTNTSLLTTSSSIDIYIASELRRMDLEQARSQLAFQQQQHAQALTEQQAHAQAWEVVIREAGPLLLHTTAVAILLLAVSISWRVITQGVVAIRRVRRY